jgi:hypothetical protein
MSGGDGAAGGVQTRINKHKTTHDAKKVEAPRVVMGRFMGSSAMFNLD